MPAFTGQVKTNRVFVRADNENFSEDLVENLGVPYRAYDEAKEILYGFGYNINASWLQETFSLPETVLIQVKDRESNKWVTL